MNLKTYLQKPINDNIIGKFLFKNGIKFEKILKEPILPVITIPINPGSTEICLGLPVVIVIGFELVKRDKNVVFYKESN